MSEITDGNCRTGEQYFRLLLDDYSTPSFVSLAKAYFGTQEQLDGFFQSIKADAQTAENYTNLLSVYDQFLSSDKDICHNVAYQEVPFLVPVTVLGEERIVLVNHSWEHQNVWHCTYNMQCDKAECTHLWLSYNGRYLRCIQVQFTNLRYEDLFGEYVRPIFICGFPHQLEFERPYAYSRLFVEEMAFANEAEAIEDRKAFAQNPNPIFSGVLDDLFGDG